MNVLVTMTILDNKGDKHSSSFFSGFLIEREVTLLSVGIGDDDTLYISICQMKHKKVLAVSMSNSQLTSIKVIITINISEVIISTNTNPPFIRSKKIGESAFTSTRYRAE